jgi:uncharacterized protein YdeI (YjbR/CyaY-like superfamily)
MVRLCSKAHDQCGTIAFVSSKKPGVDHGGDAPVDLMAAVNATPAAKAAWTTLTPISRRDFVSWINEAKKPETRKRRIERCCENLASGKRRPCCYAVVPMDFYKVLGEDSNAKAKWSALSANEKRDFTDWIEASEDKSERKARIVSACSMILDGRRRPG